MDSVTFERTAFSSIRVVFTLAGATSTQDPFPNFLFVCYTVLQWSWLAVVKKLRRWVGSLGIALLNLSLCNILQLFHGSPHHQHHYTTACVTWRVLSRTPSLVTASLNTIRPSNKVTINSQWRIQTFLTTSWVHLQRGRLISLLPGHMPSTANLSNPLCLLMW